MIPTFVLSLRDNTTRRKSISEKLEKLDIPFEFIDAVDGRDGLAEEDAALIDRDSSIRHGRILSDPEYACALSHINAYRRIVKEDIAYALIFEDDAIPSRDLVRFLKEEHYRMADLTQLFGFRQYVRRDGAIPIFKNFRLYLPMPWLRLPGAAAYIISYAGAKHFMDHALPITAEADWPHCIGALVRKKAVRVVYPRLAGHGIFEEGATAWSSTLSQSRVRARDPWRILGVFIPPWRSVLFSILRGPLKWVGKRIG